MAQETQIGALYQSRGVGCGGRWEGGSKGRGCMYIYGWFMLRFDGKQQNSVKQLSFNKKNKLKKEQNQQQWQVTCIFCHHCQLFSLYKVLLTHSFKDAMDTILSAFVLSYESKDFVRSSLF